eukprot:jgi/Tetstr1/455806/TSEL_042598.t1
MPLGKTVPTDELKDLMPDAELSLPAFNAVTGSYDPRSLKSTLLEFKTMRYSVKYTSVPRATAVDRFERSLLGDKQRGLAARDAAWHNTEPGQKGPLRDILDMSEYTGMVFGTVGEVSKERRMTELVRSWDDARTEAFYAGHARQRRTDADLFAALLVGTADTVVALVEDGELSRAAGRLSSKGMGDLSDHAILALLRDKHPSRSHPIPDAAYDIPVDEAALAVDMRVPYQELKQHVAAGPSGMRNEYLRCLVGEHAPASGPAAVRAMSEVASMYLQGRLPGWFNRLFASARLVAPVKKLGEGRAPDVRC